MMSSQDLCQNDLRPLLEPSITKRDSAAIKRMWQQLCGQLLDYKSLESMGDSLYASSSLTVGVKQKKFAQVFTVILKENTFEVLLTITNY